MNLYLWNYIIVWLIRVGTFVDSRKLDTEKFS